MKKKVQDLLGSVIISCQAYEDTPLYGSANMKIMAESAKLGGARAVRSCWPQDIRAIKEVEGLTVIGINKVLDPKRSMDDLDYIFITPTFESAKAIVEAGCDVLALDARLLPERGEKELLALLQQIHDAWPDLPVMADCGTYEDGVFAAKSGYVDIVASTLSGLKVHHDGPDTEIVRRWKQAFDTPINGEGNVWELKDVDALVEAGADMITIGTAVTRPHLITKRFLARNARDRG